jgi:hypothetical protein
MVEEWRTIAIEHGYDYMCTEPSELLRSLIVDVVGVRAALRRTDDEVSGCELRRTAAVLTAFTAMAISSGADPRLARGWWRTSRQLAHESRNQATILWVRGQEIIRSLADHRPITTTLALVDDAAPFTVDAPPRILTGILTARAQALARAGRRDEAIAALHELERVCAILPAELTMVTDRETARTDLHWSAARLPYVESYVYSHLGRLAEAADAQQRTTSRYRPGYRRGPAQIELLRALCLVTSGDTVAGVGHAETVIAGLARSDRVRAVLELGHTVLGAIPAGDRAAPAARGLRHQLTGIRRVGPTRVVRSAPAAIRLEVS